MIPIHAEMRTISFTQSTGSDANLFRRHLTDTFRDNVLPAVWASCSPVMLTHRISYHCMQCGLFLITVLSSNALAKNSETAGTCLGPHPITLVNL